MTRNLALDFMKAPGHGIATDELRHYCEWRGVAAHEKALLHKALLSPAMGAKLRTMRFWRAGAIHQGQFYMDVFWNFDEEACPDLEDLLKRDPELFCSYSPFQEWLDEKNCWNPMSTYPYPPAKPPKR